MQYSSSGAYGSTSVTATCVMAPLLSPAAAAAAGVVRGGTPALAPAPLMTTEALMVFEAGGLDGCDSVASFFSPAASSAPVLPST